MWVSAILSGARSLNGTGVWSRGRSACGKRAVRAVSPTSLVLVIAATSICSPAIRVSVPEYAPSNRTALVTIASNTGWTSVCERLMTRRMSLVAVCCPAPRSASVSALRSRPRFPGKTSKGAGSHQEPRRTPGRTSPVAGSPAGTRAVHGSLPTRRARSGLGTIACGEEEGQTKEREMQRPVSELC